MVEFAHRYDRLWERLVVLLDTLGDVEQAAPGRLRLSVEGFEIEILMSESQWEDLVTIPNGSFVGGADHLLRTIGRAQMERAPYLVYYQYELHPSRTDVSPMQVEEEAEHRRVQDHLRAHPGAKLEVRAYPPGEGPDRGAGGSP